VLNGQLKVPSLTRLSRLAILNTLNRMQDVPFIAIVVAGIPRLMRVQPGMLAPVETTGYPAAKSRAHLAGQTIQVPDIDYLEQLARESLVFKPEKMS
jgi:chemosensory pili system protein ChpC